MAEELLDVLVGVDVSGEEQGGAGVPEIVETGLLGQGGAFEQVLEGARARLRWWVALGVNAETGEREVLGLDVGPSEDGSLCSFFLRSLVTRGLRWVKLVTSDAHRGLKGAIADGRGPTAVNQEWS